MFYPYAQPEEDRDTLEQSSLLGKEAWYCTLENIMDATLL